MHNTLIALSLLAVASLACGEQTPAPLGARPTAPAPSTSGTDEPPPPVPAKRIVEQRSPFGRLDPNNWVLDGDFEFTGREGQMPWLSVGNSEMLLNYATGGLCRSGVRCAKLVPNDVLLGWFASPPVGSTAEVTAQVRDASVAEADADCRSAARLTIYLIDAESSSTYGALSIERDLPAERGYCTYRGEFTARPSAGGALTAFYIEAPSGRVTDAADRSWYLDDVRMVEQPSVLQRARVRRAEVRPSAAEQRRIEVASELARRRRFAAPSLPQALQSDHGPQPHLD